MPTNDGRLQSRAGFTLVELVFTLALMGILLAIAAPAMGGWMKRTQMRSVLDQFTRDVAYARMLAVREGQSVALNFSPATCATSYQIQVLPSARVAKSVNLNDEARGLCISIPTSQGGVPQDAVVFNSRGLHVGGGGERAYSIEYNGMIDSVVVTAAGRIKRTP